MLWLNIIPHIPKSSRYTLGARIENKFLDLIELSYAAYFSKKDEKSAKISDCIFALDILKYLISITWEAKLISSKHFEKMAGKLEESGKMLGGWFKSLNNLQKKNRTL